MDYFNALYLCEQMKRAKSGCLEVMTWRRWVETKGRSSMTSRATWRISEKPEVMKSQSTSSVTSGETMQYRQEECGGGQRKTSQDTQCRSIMRGIRLKCYRLNKMGEIPFILLLNIPASSRGTTFGLCSLATLFSISVGSKLKEADISAKRKSYGSAGPPRPACGQR